MDKATELSKKRNASALGLPRKHIQNVVQERDPFLTFVPSQTNVKNVTYTRLQPQDHDYSKPLCPPKPEDVPTIMLYKWNHWEAKRFPYMEGVPPYKKEENEEGSNDNSTRTIGMGDSEEEQLA